MINRLRRREGPETKKAGLDVVGTSLFIIRPVMAESDLTD
jgi:hypothetical protein